MKKTPLNRYSLKKIAQLHAEAPIRIALCERAGGRPITTQATIYRKGIAYPYTRVICAGGTCECQLPNCPKHPSFGQNLEPHEKLPRGKGGVLSLQNSIMVLRQCHRILQNNVPKWSSN